MRYELIQPMIKEDERREILRALAALIDRPEFADYQKAAAFLIIEHARALIQPKLIAREEA